MCSFRNCDSGFTLLGMRGFKVTYSTWARGVGTLLTAQNESNLCLSRASVTHYAFLRTGAFFRNWENFNVMISSSLLLIIIRVMHWRCAFFYSNYKIFHSLSLQVHTFQYPHSSYISVNWINIHSCIHKLKTHSLLSTVFLN